MKEKNLVFYWDVLLWNVSAVLNLKKNYAKRCDGEMVN